MRFCSLVGSLGFGVAMERPCDGCTGARRGIVHAITRRDSAGTPHIAVGLNVHHTLCKHISPWCCSQSGNVTKQAARSSPLSPPAGEPGMRVVRSRGGLPHGTSLWEPMTATKWPGRKVVRSYGCPCALNVRTRSLIYMWQAVHSLKACFWCGLEYCTRRSIEYLYGPRYKRDSARPRFLCATSRVNGRVHLAAGPKF